MSNYALTLAALISDIYTLSFTKAIFATQFEAFDKGKGH